jgi:release factor glutamine methyltransferase
MNKGLRYTRDLLIHQLEAIYPKNEAKSMVEELIHHITGLEKWEAVVNPDKQISGDNLRSLYEAMDALKMEKPLQYITGNAEFYGMTLDLDERVLIPRPETEELVGWVIADHRQSKEVHILDIGTGSGCIALALKKNLRECSVYAMDVSPGAVEVAAGNAAKHALDIIFHTGDIFQPEMSLQGLYFDVIVSNPPYVLESEKSLIRNNVKGFEPAGALFVADEDPLNYYKAIAGFAMERLTASGAVYVEINESFGEECIQLFRSHRFSEVMLRKDMRGKDRMVKASGLAAN